MSQKISDRTKELVEPLTGDMGFEVIDVDFVKEGADWYLRVFIDKRGGIRIDDCEQLSKALSPILDDENYISRAYSLVVSSPGLDRPLRTEADYRRYEGELLEVRMLPGRIKTGLREETPVNQAELISVAGEPEKTDKISGQKKGGADKKRRFVASGPDMVSGILVSFDAGRLYLSDNRGDIFSLAREDIKTVKRAIKFG